MPVFEHSSYLPFSREDVFSWYSRPGALTRLHPPFAGRVISEPSHGLTDGSESTLGINLPGLLGTSLTAAAGLISSHTGLPLRTWQQWDARHSDFRFGSGFSDHIISGPLSSWHHEREFTDEGEGTRLVEKVHYQLPLIRRTPAAVAEAASSRFESELRRIFDYRERQTAEELAFHHNVGSLSSSVHQSRVRVVAVSGASGTVGQQVCAILGGAGIEVRPMVRSSADSSRRRARPRAGETISWDPRVGKLDPADLEGVDAVINLAGHPLAGRFTAAHKRKVKESRVDSSALIARTLAQLETADRRGRALINGSAIGFYGATRDDRTYHQDILTEDFPPGTDFLAEVCREWEKATTPAHDAGVRVSMIRTGIVQTPTAGVLQQMLPLFALGVGGRLGSHQWQSWISIDDIASLIVHAALEGSVEGPLNATAPHPIQAKDYARSLAAVLHRPAAVPVPRFGPQLLLGRQGAREIATADQRASAEKTLATGFGFRHPFLLGALRHVLGR